MTNNSPSPNDDLNSISAKAGALIAILASSPTAPRLRGRIIPQDLQHTTNILTHLRGALSALQEIFPTANPTSNDSSNEALTNALSFLKTTISAYGTVNKDQAMAKAITVAGAGNCGISVFNSGILGLDSARALGQRHPGAYRNLIVHITWARWHAVELLRGLVGRSGLVGNEELGSLLRLLI